MNLSNAEKLILAMLCDIHEKLEMDTDGDNINHELVREAISSDNTWALNWEYGDWLAFSREEDPKIVTDVCNILDMWSFIEDSFSELSDGDKKIYKESVPNYYHDPKFAGFDGNNEHKYLNAASFLVDKLNRYDSFKGRIINSHSSKVPHYLKMYEIFEEIRIELHSRLMNADELARVINYNDNN